MADEAVDGILSNLNLSTEQVTVLYPYLREVYINEAPLCMRLPRQPAEGQSYNIITYDVRKRSYTLSAAINNVGTTLTLDDTTPIQVGDILSFYDTTGVTNERVQVTALPTNNTATIVRGLGGTTAVANTTLTNTSLTVTLVGNSSTGSEVLRASQRGIRHLIPQYVQTFLYAVQVGGLPNAVQNIRLPPGTGDVFTLEQRTKMTEMMRDEEYSLYYSNPQAPTASANATQAGLIYLIGYYAGLQAAPVANSNVNVKTTGGASYTFLNFVSDGIQKAIDGGGDPDTVVCSTDFLTGLQTWGFAKTQIINPRQTQIGLPINEISVPFASKVITFIPSYQLAKGTAIVLTERDVSLRYIRDERFQRRGLRGDALEGDFIADLCGEIGHPGWHSVVSGITSYA